MSAPSLVPATNRVISLELQHQYDRRVHWTNGDARKFVRDAIPLVDQLVVETRLEEAEIWAERCVDAVQQDSALQVQALATLAKVKQRKSEYTEAETACREAIRIAESLDEIQPLKIAELRNQLAIVFKYAGKFDEAKQLYLLALATYETELGAEHPDVAAICHNLGGVEHARGNYTEAEPYARRSVELSQEAYGRDDLRTVEDFAALASILDGLQRHAEAVELYREAISIFEQKLGPEDYEVAVNLNNLGASLLRLDRLDEAEQHFQRSLSIKGKILGDDHADVAMTLNNLALLCKKTGRTHEAKQHYERCIEIFSTRLGPDDRHVAICRKNLAKL